MNILKLLQSRFDAALEELEPAADQRALLVDMVRPSQDPKFGDYQANFAMPLGQRLGRAPRDVATEIALRVVLSDICDPPQVAGPGFINLRLKDEWLREQLVAMVGDERLAIETAAEPRTYVLDYSAPNVAKAMHVGHIRSTVIGAALDRTLRFLGHSVISDNHIGDWGTQFGMIIYGYKHFLNAEAYKQNPVAELSRLYRLVRQLIDYREALARLPRLRAEIERHHQAPAEPVTANPKEAEKTKRRNERRLHEWLAEINVLEAKIAAAQSDPSLAHFLRHHEGIEAAVLAETARLHAGNAENLQLWKEFLPACLIEIERIYRRLDVSFDFALGESFYHDMLAPVVAELLQRDIARESEGAICVFNEGHPAPLIIRKQDGAFLYATTDLATIQYRVEHWHPDAILYVVDHRQALHFEQLFATARRWGYDRLELAHVSFGTVLGDDGRPFKTRSGDTVGLEGLLDEAVSRALAIVSANDDAKPNGRELSDQQRQDVADAVGLGAVKYADLAQNRTTDYVFSYDKMLAMTGNTATYMQYAHARVASIFSKGGVDLAALRARPTAIQIEHPAERALAVALMGLAEALEQVTADYQPHFLAAYLFELANRYSTFFDQCPVLRADSKAARHSRLLLCDLTARTLRLGLALLGIRAVEKM